jgi:hypothetical protein
LQAALAEGLFEALISSEYSDTFLRNAWNAYLRNDIPAARSELQKSSWFQTKGTVAAERITLKLQARAVYEQQLDAEVSEFTRELTRLGLQLPAGTDLRKFVENFYDAGLDFNSTRVKDMLAGLGTTQQGGATTNVKDALKAAARSFGVTYNDAWFEQAARSVALGTSTLEQWQDEIKTLAKNSFPAFAKQIDAGLTVEAIVSPYRGKMATILELPYEMVSLDDPLMRAAYANGEPMGLWDFEKMLRNDQRWAYTKQARSELDSVGRQVLKDFGLVN